MSISPGVTHLPLPSTRTAPAGAVRPVPMAATLPSCSSTSVPSRRVPVPVSTVAPEISTGGEAIGAEVRGEGWTELPACAPPVGAVVDKQARKVAPGRLAPSEGGKELVRSQAPEANKSERRSEGKRG